ncbi:MAG: hypothetical protein ACOH18_05195 [Candidatus Saccharimonadaceae bacterium]
MNELKNELPSTLPDKDAYSDLLEQATSTEDIVTLREMAQGDLASVAITPENSSPITVTAIGSEKFSELSQVDPKAVQAAMAVHSEDWHTEK